ncbi:MAG TPA: hypothetical protein ENJ56_02895, partial [Anaerolineae bacterium]|nr:hypothetical protein [Anaerolineae bacterium]
MQIASKLRLTAIFFTITMLVILASRTFATDAAAQPATLSATVEVLRSDQNGLQFSLTVPTAEVSSTGAVSVAGLEGRFSTMGTPDLPYYSALIAVPPEASVQLAVSAENETIRATDAIAPVPTAKVGLDTDYSAISTIDEFEQEYLPDMAIYSEDTNYPAMRYELSEPMYVRDLRVVKLTLYPVRYNPVAQTLTEVGKFNIGITFAGADRSVETLPTPTNSTTAVLNPEQAAGWHALPRSFQPRATTFPIGKQTLKITIDKDGIYSLTPANLTSAGMGGINPNTIEMMWQGQPIAYQFIGNNNAQFEAGEEIRFYGWAFDGDRHDKLFVGDKNVFWLWADGSPTLASSASNGSGGTAVTTWRSVVEKDDRNFFYTGGTLYSNVATHDNEPDAWFLLTMANHVTETVSVDLPDPVAIGSNARLLVEVASITPAANQDFSVILNDVNQITDTWNGLKNRNLIKNNVPHSLLNDGANTFQFISNHANFSNDMLVNRVRVEYDRNLTAINDTLQFDFAAAGNHKFQVNGYAESTATNFVAWDVTDRVAPTVVGITAAD